jgi:hypothetical protein
MDLPTFLDFMLCRRWFEIKLVGEDIMDLLSKSSSQFLRLSPPLLVYCDSPMQVSADLTLCEVSRCRMKYQLNSDVLWNDCRLRREGIWIASDDTLIRRVSVLNGNVWFIAYVRADHFDRVTQPRIIDGQSDQSEFISIQLFTGFQLSERSACGEFNVSAESRRERFLCS